MRKINMKKLNNKGFTLIELLAVIVILAVVMGVASTQVLSAMNNSRKSSLQNSALSAADAFRTSYAEYSLGGTKKLVGWEDTTSTKTNENLLKGAAQSLTNYASGLNLTTANYNLASSYVKFDTTYSTFTVCLVAANSGSYYVAAADITNYNGTKPTMSVGTNPTSGMWACSDNKHSWK